MSMTFDDLCEVYQTAALALPDKGGIRAVVKALRDEMLNDMALHTSLIDSDDVTEWFNEILAQSEARQAGVLAVESREVAMVPEATEAPAADLYAVVGQSCDEVVSIRSAPAADAIETLVRERDEARAERDAADGIWPEWAQQILERLRDLGFQYDAEEEIQLPDDFISHVEGWLQATEDRYKVRAEAAEAERDEARAELADLKAKGWKEVADEYHQRTKAAEAEVARLREAVISVTASLEAAISLLERGGKAAKKAAPSDKMFDQMIADYKRSTDISRAALEAK